MIAGVVQSQELDISKFGSIIAILNNSRINSGVITFEKYVGVRTTTTTYRYEDSLTSIRVESHVDSQNSEYNGEHIYFDTQSPDFLLFGIRVGTPVDEVIRILGSPMMRSNTELEYIIRGYFLLFEINNNRVSRIFYNPYE
jgi:hypothetical protein